MQSKMPDGSIVEQTIPASHAILDQAKRIQDMSSSSSSGGNTEHSQQQRPVVPDLSSLQLKLAQLTSTGSSMASEASNVPGAVQTNTQTVTIPVSGLTY